MENETEDQILARALGESLRHYNEVELPRLTQTETKTGDGQIEEVQEEIGGVDDWDYWEEWDDEQIENAVQVEEAVTNAESVEAQTSHHKNPDKKYSSKSMNDYIHREVLPKPSNVSVGEIGYDGADGFDNESGKMWIYPCNFPVRKYQLDIVHSALFDNTLVSLPTGLGKTFIAAVVMYNFYRWFPLGKIIFLAPTRPLVAQQIHACYNIMGIPQEDTIELTGTKSGMERSKAWKEKRVFFATPQVFANDLGTGVCPGELVRCVVVDEAHRAAGKHAICQSFRSLFRLRDQYSKSRFRVLALSATPGKNVNAVASVVSALKISKLELRDELSPDVAPYTHRRNLETVVVPLGPELSETREKFIMVMDSFVDRLINRKFLYCVQKSKLNKFQLLQARENFRKNAPPGMTYAEKGLVEGDFATCISLVHALGLLLTHGQRTFMSFMKGVLNGDKSSALVKGRLCHNIPLSSLLSSLQDKLGTSMPQPAPDVSLSEGMTEAVKKDDGNSFIISHPKMDHLRNIVVQHFESYQKNGESTRVMIFCEYRDPVVEICNMLMQHWPLIKPMSFVGQASSSVQVEQNMAGPSKGTKGFTQKQQLQVLRSFREGGYNVLVSTCVGEEGLDIGEVDLIVCYDAPHASPLRLVQRMGRTGRKREGRVVTLVTQEIEEHKHQQGLRQKNTIVKSLLASKVLESSLCRQNARVLPPDSNPSCHIMPMTIPELQDNEEKKKKSKVKAEKTISIEGMLKKGKRKASKKNNDSNFDDRKSNDEFGREKGGEEACTNTLGETSPFSTKHKGRGKISKNVRKVKPRKGIKEFFNVQKAKEMEIIVLSDGDEEDDDFIRTTRDNKTNAKCYEDCEEAVVLEEDMHTIFHSSPPAFIKELSTNKVNYQEVVPNIHQITRGSNKKAIVSEASTIPTNLLALEDSLPMLFGNLCCSNLKMDSPYRCSVIMPLFQLRHSTHNSPNIYSVLSFDSITADALNDFDVEKEASKIGAWKQSTIVNPSKIDKHSLIGNYEVLPENYDFVGRNSTTDTSLTSPLRCSHVTKKGNLIKKQCDKSDNTGVKVIYNFDDNEMIEILDSDGEKNNHTMLKKKKPRVTTTSTPDIETVKEGLFWNVLGRKEAKVQHTCGLENISNTREGEKLKKSSMNSKSELIPNKTVSYDVVNAKGIVTISNPEGNSSETDNLMLTLNPNSHNNRIFTSPDIMEDKYCDSHERTPEKESEEAVPKSKDKSNDNTALQKQSSLASSTPKVHQRNLFSPQACLPSPIGHSSKRPIATLLPTDVNVLDDKLLFPHRSNTPSPPQQLSLHLKKTMAQVRSESDISELPNFDLGSEYEFASISSDETIFEPEIDSDHKKETIYGSGIRSSLKKGDESQLLLEEDNLNAKHLQEQGQERLQLKVKKSVDLFENTSTVEVSKTMTRDQLPRQLGNTFGYINDYSFTVTQAVNMLVPSEIPPIGNEEESCSERRQVELEKKYGKCKPDEISCPTKADKLHISNKSTKKEQEIRQQNTEEKASSCKKVSGSFEKNEKLANSEVVNNDFDNEINFDIGDEILLDVSADLFAEDEEKKSNGEVGLMKSLQTPSGKEPVVEVTSHCEKESQIKLAENGSWNKVAKCAGNGVGVKSPKASGNENEDFVCKSRRNLQSVSENENEHVSHKPQNKLQEKPSCTSSWNTDGWLSKGAHSSKSKFSLGLKGIKRQLESEMSSETKVVHLEKGKDSRFENWEADEAVTLKPKCFSKSKRDDNWIDEISTERTILEAIDATNLKLKELPQSPEAALSKIEASLANNDTISSLEFEDHDVFENFLDCQPKLHSGKQQVCNAEKEVDSIRFGHNTSRHLGEHSRSSLQQCLKEPEIQDKGTVLHSLKVSSGKDEEKLSLNRNVLTNQRKELSREAAGKVDGDLGDWAGHLENSHRSGSGLSEGSDDFEGQRISTGKKKLRRTNSKDTLSSEEKLPIRVKRVHRRKSHEFLDTQAEESFVEMRGVRRLQSDEEEDDDGRGQSQYYDPSFINDGGHNSQETEVDMHAKYLQSVRSPRNAKYKIPNFPLLEAKNDDFASVEQAYHHGESESYMNDSFCVDGESNSDEKEASVDELEVLEVILAKIIKDKKIRKRKEKDRSSSDEQVESVEIKHDRKEEKRIIGHRKKRKRKRIVMYDSSEDEQDHPQNSPIKKSLISEAEIPVIDEKLLEALSQDFEDDPPEHDQVGAKCFLPVDKVDRSLVCENVHSNEQGNKSCDSTQFTERSSTSTEKNVERNVKGVSEQSGKNTWCDGVVGSHERKENTESGENSTLKTEIRKKELTVNDKCSFNWSSDLFNLSDNDDDLFSVIKSPPNISKSSSIVKVLPAADLVPVMPTPCPEINKLNKITVSIGGVNSKEIKCNRSPGDNVAIIKVQSRDSVGENATVSFTKPNCSSSPCFQNMRPSQSTMHNYHEDPKGCSSLNEKSPGAGKEMIASSRPVVSPSSSSCDPSVSIAGKNKKNVGVTKTLIVVSPGEACRASEVMSALRAIEGVCLVVYAASGSPSIPYSLGRNLCLLRVSAAGLGRNSKASEVMETAFSLFRKVAVIVEWEKECDGAQNSWSKKKSNCTWNSGSVPASYSTSAYIALLNLRDAGVNVLHSSGEVETAHLIAETARHQQYLESQLNMQPVKLPLSFEKSDPVLKFYASLPGLNTFQAFGLLHQFPKISNFLQRCTSAQSIQIAACLELRKALHLHKILANVHVSDT